MVEIASVVVIAPRMCLQVLHNLGDFLGSLYLR